MTQFFSLHPEHLKEVRDGFEAIVANRQSNLSHKSLMLFEKYKSNMARAIHENSFPLNYLLWHYDQLERSSSRKNEAMKAYMVKMSRWVWVLDSYDPSMYYWITRFNTAHKVPNAEKPKWSNGIDEFLEHVGSFGYHAQSYVFQEISSSYFRDKELSLKGWIHLARVFGVKKSRANLAHLLSIDIKKIPQMPAHYANHILAIERSKVFDPAERLSAYECLRRVKDTKIALLNEIIRLIGKDPHVLEVCSQAIEDVAFNEPVKNAAGIVKWIKDLGLKRSYLYKF